MAFFNGLNATWTPLSRRLPSRSYTRRHFVDDSFPAGKRDLVHPRVRSSCSTSVPDKNPAIFTLLFIKQASKGISYTLRKYFFLLPRSPSVSLCSRSGFTYCFTAYRLWSIVWIGRVGSNLHCKQILRRTIDPRLASVRGALILVQEKSQTRCYCLCHPMLYKRHIIQISLLATLDLLGFGAAFNESPIVVWHNETIDCITCQI